MLHLWLLQICLRLSYYIATIGYPLMETYKAIESKELNKTKVKILAYWIIYLGMTLVDSILFFLSEYTSRF